MTIKCRMRRWPGMRPPATWTGKPGFALRVLPDRQLEAAVLRHYMGLSEQQAAVTMGISTGAARAHLARGAASLPRPPQPE